MRARALGRLLKLAAALTATALLVWSIYRVLAGEVDALVAVPGSIASLALLRRYPHLGGLMVLLALAAALASLEPLPGWLVGPIAPIP